MRAPPSGRAGPTFAALLGIVLAGAAFSIAVVLPSMDPDTYWHLASARWMVEHGQLLTRDPFSSTAAGAPYTVGEWLGELVWYGAYLAGGWPGIAILRALVVAVATYCTTRLVLLVQPRPVLAIAPLLAALAIGKTTWTDRPQLFTLALFALFLYVLASDRLRAGTRAVWTLVPLALVWSNLHGGYAVGLGLIAVFLVDALVRRDPRWRVLAAVLALAAGASALNPESFGPLGAAGHVTNPPRFVAEELPPDLFSPQGLTFGVLFVVALGSAVVSGGGALAVLWALLLVPLVWLGLSAQRHLPLAAIPLAAFVADAAPRALARWVPGLAFPAVAPVRARPGRALTLAVLVVAACLGAAQQAPAAPDLAAYPASALEALRTAPRELLNEYDWGGYLIWNAPEHPVFIDGRLFLYLPTVFDDYQRAVDLHPGFRDVLDRHHVDAVLLRPSRALAVYLTEAGWRVVARDGERSVLLVRP